MRPGALEQLRDATFRFTGPLGVDVTRRHGIEATPRLMGQNARQGGLARPRWAVQDSPTRWRETKGLAGIRIFQQVLDETKGRPHFFCQHNVRPRAACAYETLTGFKLRQRRRQVVVGNRLIGSKGFQGGSVDEPCQVSRRTSGRALRPVLVVDVSNGARMQQVFEHGAAFVNFRWMQRHAPVEPSGTDHCCIQYIRLGGCSHQHHARFLPNLLDVLKKGFQKAAMLDVGLRIAQVGRQALEVVKTTGTERAAPPARRPDADVRRLLPTISRSLR